MYLDITAHGKKKLYVNIWVIENWQICSKDSGLIFLIDGFLQISQKFN